MTDYKVEEIAHLPSIPELRRSWPDMINGSNYIDHAAQTLADWMDRDSRPAFFSWNGTPFDAFPGDTAELILHRYWETRELWQLAIEHGWKNPLEEQP